MTITRTTFDKETFDKVIKKLESITRNIIFITKIVLNEEDLVSRNSNFVESNLLALQAHQSNMDNAITDFYHIIGMTNLNAAQMAKLSSRFRKLIQTRDDLKRSISILTTYKTFLSQFKNDPAKYKIKVLGEKVTLKVEKVEEVAKNG